MTKYLLPLLLLLGLTVAAQASGTNCYTSCNSNGTTTTCSTSCD